MGKKVRSARGSSVDFDLMKIKQQIAANPAPMNVKEREKFIDSRIRRRSRRKKVDAADLEVETLPKTKGEELIEEPDIDEDLSSDVETAAHTNDAEQPTTEEDNKEEEISDDLTEPEKKKVRKVRRKK